MKQGNIEDILRESRLQKTSMKIENIDENNEEYLYLEDKSRVTSGQKWWASIILGFIFAILSSSTTYSITNSAYNLIGLSTFTGHINCLGLITHTIIFIIIVRLILW